MSSDPSKAERLPLAAGQPPGAPAEAQGLALETLSAIRRQRPPARLLSAFAWRYLVTVTPLTAAGIGLALRPGWGMWLTFALVAGFTQNALGILTHEGSHYFLHPVRETNDTIADWFVCAPILNAVATYRAEHLDHHRQCCGPADPYFRIYGPFRTRAEVLAGFAEDVTGLTAVRAFLRRQTATARPPSAQVAFAGRLAVVHGLVAVSLTVLTGRWFAYPLLWLLPLATIPFVVNRLRTFVEHHDDPSPHHVSRGVRPTWLEYLLVAPYGYAFHFEHHLVPEVPYFQLPWLHASLRARGFQHGPQRWAARGYARTFAALFGGLV